MKSHLIIGLLAMSFLYTLPVPAQAFDITGSNNTGFPTIEGDSSPPWPGSLDSTSDSSPLLGNAHGIDTSPTPYKPTIISNPHGIDVTPDQQPGVGKPAGTIQVGSAARPGMRLMAACAVAGTPVEFPDDIVITNIGSADIPAGTKIIWRTSGPTVTGTVLVSKTLRVGRSATLNGALPGGIEAGTPCKVSAVGA